MVPGSHKKFNFLCEPINGQYGEDVHHLLAQHNLAPTLHAYSDLEGAPKAIVMGYLDPSSYLSPDNFRVKDIVAGIIDGCVSVWPKTGRGVSKMVLGQMGGAKMGRCCGVGSRSRPSRIELIFYGLLIASKINRERRKRTDNRKRKNSTAQNKRKIINARKRTNSLSFSFRIRSSTTSGSSLVPWSAMK